MESRRGVSGRGQESADCKERLKTNHFRKVRCDPPPSVVQTGATRSADVGMQDLTKLHPSGDRMVLEDGENLLDLLLFLPVLDAHLGRNRCRSIYHPDQAIPTANDANVDLGTCD